MTHQPTFDGGNLMNALRALLAGVAAIAWGTHLIYPLVVWAWLGACALSLAYMLELRRVASREEDES